MEAFSIPDAAFTGFRIVRERPRAVAVWAGIQLAASVILGVAMVALAGPALTGLQSLKATTVMAMSTAQLGAYFRTLAPLYGVVLVYSLLFNPLIYAAMNRAVLRPDDDRLGYFRVGADELRQLGLILLTFAVMFGIYLAAIVLAVVLTLALALAAAPLVALIMLGAIVGMIFVMVRLSLASALTFATGRISLFGSWALTRGRFWPMLATYLLAVVLACVVTVLGGVVSSALAAVATLAIGGGAVGAAAPVGLTPLALMLSPSSVAGTLVGAIIAALIWPVVFTPAATIYLRLTAGARP